MYTGISKSKTTQPTPVSNATNSIETSLLLLGILPNRDHKPSRIISLLRLYGGGWLFMQRAVAMLEITISASGSLAPEPGLRPTARILPRQKKTHPMDESFFLVAGAGWCTVLVARSKFLRSQTCTNHATTIFALANLCRRTEP